MDGHEGKRKPNAGHGSAAVHAMKAIHCLHEEAVAFISGPIRAETATKA
jgi:hypothetical protein